MREQPEPPVLRIEHGNPTAEEIATVVAVLSAVGGDTDDARQPRSTWGGRARSSWRRSALPR